MTLEAAIALFGLTFMLGVSPGPGLFAIIARCLAQGPWRTLPFVAGLLLGDVLFLILAIVGLSALAATLGPVFAVVKWVGAAYLVWLGIRTWRAAVPPAEALETGAAAPQPALTRAGMARAALAGFTLTLGNPKVILFYGAVMPTFMDLTQLGTAGIVEAAAITFAGVFCGILPYIVAAARLRGVIRSATARRRLNRGAGAVMVGAGAAVAAS